MEFSDTQDAKDYLDLFITLPIQKGHGDTVTINLERDAEEQQIGKLNRALSAMGLQGNMVRRRMHDVGTLDVNNWFKVEGREITVSGRFNLEVVASKYRFNGSESYKEISRRP